MTPMSRSGIFLLILSLAGLAGAQEPAIPDTAMYRAVEQVRQVLVSPREQAFAQVLVGAEVLRDPRDTSFYDVVVRFDPERYRDPYLGSYPLTFEDQGVLWGKRLALYSRIASWKAGRFYLHDLSTGHQVWVDLATARLLSLPYGTPPKAKTFAAWLPYIHNSPPSTEPRTLGLWLRLMVAESRDLVLYEWRAAHPATIPAADSSGGQ